MKQIDKFQFKYLAIISFNPTVNKTRWQKNDSQCDRKFSKDKSQIYFLLIIYNDILRLKTKFQLRAEYLEKYDYINVVFKTLE